MTSATLPPCSGDPDMWYSTNAAKVAKAQAICQTCPIRRDCEQIALESDESWGIWAGHNRDRTRAIHALAGAA